MASGPIKYRVVRPTGNFSTEQLTDENGRPVPDFDNRDEAEAYVAHIKGEHLTILEVRDYVPEKEKK